MLPFDDVLRRIAVADALGRPIVAATLAHLDAADLARAVSLYTSTNARECAAGLAWSAEAHAKGSGADPARVRAAKQVANAVLSALQQKAEPPATRRTRASRADDGTIPILLDCFRIAMAALLAWGCAGDTLAQVGLSVARKLLALERVGVRS